ncbi:type II toxin-antitoxin system RelE/ParE family toxin [Methanosphaera sp. BMS]|uniref:type II toxin-antitoxin system RelE family toxin n=1 Tax=Methanosphaera sp. BMS TaxID=1789762 RepID=UPI000DC1E682|nr:type II toxin-antitoxin system RelE/ParE family toxin [Methanosphaera sp. BMS]AWX33190.1 hypothetical protein AW729_08870 [Methanosphaera sp. BMS]
MSFNIIYTKKALKNLNKYKKKNKTVYKQLKEGIYKIEKNPYKSSNKQLESIRCPKCKRHKVGNYRIVYYIHTKSNIIEIQNVIARKSDYNEY